MVEKPYGYDETVYIKPGVNGQFLVWLLLLGLPALMLFLVYTKTGEVGTTPAPANVEHEQGMNIESPEPHGAEGAGGHY